MSKCGVVLSFAVVTARHSFLSPTKQRSFEVIGARLTWRYHRMQRVRVELCLTPGVAALTGMSFPLIIRVPNIHWDRSAIFFPSSPLTGGLCHEFYATGSLSASIFLLVHNPRAHRPRKHQRQPVQQYHRRPGSGRTSARSRPKKPAGPYTMALGFSLVQQVDRRT